jgi:hypothetical protein
MQIVKEKQQDNFMKLFDVFTSSSWASGFKSVTCSREGCSRWLTQRHLESRRVGVTFKDDWYCCYRCFIAPLEQQFNHILSSERASSSKHNFRMPLGLTMVSRGLLNDEQLRKANEEHKKTGDEIGDLVVRLGYVDEKELTSVRAAQWGAPVYRRPSLPVASNVHIPSTLMSLHSMIPLRHPSGGEGLMVGFVNAIEYGPLYAIEQITKRKAQPCFVTPTDFLAQLETQRTANEPEEMVYDNVQNPLEMARITCNYGALIDADEISIVRCREFIWTRLQGGKKSADLLFQAP